MPLLSPSLDRKWTARLENWALWKHGLDSVCRRIELRYIRIRKGGPHIITEEPPPRPQPLIGEAFDTDKLVKRLCHEHQEAVDCRFVWTYPETLEARSAALNISRKTLYNRVEAAMVELERMDAASRKARRDYLHLVTCAAD